MDRYFYSVELDDNGNKIVHLFGNVYFNDADESDTNYRHAAWTFFYLTLSEIAALMKNDIFFDHVNSLISYLDDITEQEAIETCYYYFSGEPGINIHIKDVNENTPCGDYWFEEEWK